MVCFSHTGRKSITLLKQQQIDLVIGVTLSRASVQKKKKWNIMLIFVIVVVAVTMSINNQSQL